MQTATFFSFKLYFHYNSKQTNVSWQHKSQCSKTMFLSIGLHLAQVCLLCSNQWWILCYCYFTCMEDLCALKIQTHEVPQKCCTKEKYFNDFTKNVRKHFKNVFRDTWGLIYKVKEWLERNTLSVWTYNIFFPLSSIHSRWWKAYSRPLYFWTDLKTDYTAALISPESQGILDVRASLTNECEALSYSLFVIKTVPSTAPIWIKAICFAFLCVIGLHTIFALSKFANEI